MEKTTRQGALCCVHYAKHYSGDRIKTTETGGACGTYVEEVRTGFWFGDLRKRDY